MASGIFDEIDARLLELLQREFPLTARPFDAIAEMLGVSPAEAMDRVRRLKSDRVIRQISAIFDSKSLGYSGALVAFRVRPDAIDQVAEAVSSHPGVSHCYSRDAAFNLWFTITLPPEKDQQQEVEALARTKGVEAHAVLPALRVFKIGVFLDVGDPEARKPEEAAKKKHAGSAARARALTEGDRAAVRALQKDLPIVDEPFAELAGEVGMTAGDLIARADEFLASGVMRRYAAVLRHQRAGYRSNAMVCWRAAGEEIEKAGEVFARHTSVSHCYERPVSPDWPYPLYTMVHGRDDQELERIIGELVESSGLDEFLVLRSVKEYKKSRVVYFE